MGPAAVLTCELCHQRDADVQLGMVEYRQGQDRWQNIDRCQDRKACRTRLEDAGEKWPLREPFEMVVEAQP